MFYSLPNCTEERFTSYIAANYTGDYTVTKSFTVSPYPLPAIIVKAGQFKEIEPGTHVYQGQLSIVILTQIDDVTEPVTVHDNTVAAIYEVLANNDALNTFVNQPGYNFHLWGMYCTGYDQKADTDKDMRALMSVFDYTISAQALSI